MGEVDSTARFARYGNKDIRVQIGKVYRIRRTSTKAAKWRGSGGKSIRQALDICQRNMNNLTKLRYRELIREEEFIKQRGELTREEIGLRQRLEQLDTERWIEPSRNLFLFSNRAAFWLTHGTAQEKRLIVATVGSNLSLSAKKLSVDAKKPFRLLEKNGHIRNWCTIVNDVRTLFREEPGIAIPLLPEPNVTQIEAA